MRMIKSIYYFIKTIFYYTIKIIEDSERFNSVYKKIFKDFKYFIYNIREYKLIVCIDLPNMMQYLRQLFNFSLIYFFVTSLLLAKGYFLGNSVETWLLPYFYWLYYCNIKAWLDNHLFGNFVSLYFYFYNDLPVYIFSNLPESWVSHYFDYKQYLMMQEQLDGYAQDSKIIRDKLAHTKLEIKNLQSELQTLQKSCENSKKSFLSDKAAFELGLEQEFKDCRLVLRYCVLVSTTVCIILFIAVK